MVGFTPVFNLEKKFQASLCLTFPSVASSELLLVLPLVGLDLGAKPSLTPRKQTCFSTAAPAIGQKV